MHPIVLRLPENLEECQSDKTLSAATEFAIHIAEASHIRRCIKDDHNGWMSGTNRKAALQ